MGMFGLNVGDISLTKNEDTWSQTIRDSVLVSAYPLGTSRQKYQRAFAAEFLCPLSSLQAYLENDYSESAIEDAAEYFKVSSQTVESILENNGLISSPQSASYLERSFPY